MSFVVLGGTCAGFLVLSLLFFCASMTMVAGSRRNAVVVAALACVYYATSIGMSLFNKWILYSFADGQFSFPLISTTVHVTMKFIFAALCLGCPGRGPFAATTRKDFGWLILPIGAATALDIGLSNYSLLTVSLTLYTIGESRRGDVLPSLLPCLHAGGGVMACRHIQSRVFPRVDADASLHLYYTARGHYHLLMLVLRCGECALVAASPMCVGRGGRVRGIRSEIM